MGLGVVEELEQFAGSLGVGVVRPVATPATSAGGCGCGELRLNRDMLGASRRSPRTPGFARCPRQRGPPPGLFSAHNRPPWASRIDRLMARPMPMPVPGEERLPQPGELCVGESSAGIAERDPDGLCILPARGDAQGARAGFSRRHGVQGVHDQVDDDCCNWV